MLKLKGCPKCQGDVRIDRDQYGWYEQCMQCGSLYDLEPFNEKSTEAALLTPVIAGRKVIKSSIR